ncbi:hypothetical protein KAU32_02655 [bacterium]|nr:hypothetical protein [bacterium]
MEEILYVLLGGFLAILGGLISQWMQDKIETENKERGIMLEIMKELDRCNFPSEKYRRNTSISEEELLPNDEIEARQKFWQLIIDLIYLSIQIRSRKHRKLGIMITNFCTNDEFRSDGDIKDIRVLITKHINEKLIVQFEKEIRKLKNS